MSLAAVFASRPLTPTRLAQVRREAASVLSLLDGEARDRFAAAWMSEVASRRTDARPVPAHPIDPNYSRQRWAILSLAREGRLTDEDAREQLRDLEDQYCFCDGMCECDHP